jgi:hypothetical protein
MCIYLCIDMFIYLYKFIYVYTGRCMDMKELAISATNNGDKATYTYGEDPNNRLTWDGGRIFGCLCDTGFHGYDCSLSSCPRYIYI